MAKRQKPIDPALLDELLAGQDPKTVLSSKGLLGDLKKALAERILNAELDHHLDSAEEQEVDNHRNGSSPKTVFTESGAVDLAIPRDRHEHKISDTPEQKPRSPGLFVLRLFQLTLVD